MIRHKRPVRSLPPASPTGPAPPRRSVCAPGAMSRHSIADQPRMGERTMSFHSWLQNLRSALAPGRGQRHHRRRGSLRAATHRPNLEVLEDRCVPAFLPPVYYDVAAGPIAVVTADFNGDGHLDLATASLYGYPDVSVLLGNGDGTFQAAQNYCRRHARLHRSGGLQRRRQARPRDWDGYARRRRGLLARFRRCAFGQRRWQLPVAVPSLTAGSPRWAWRWPISTPTANSTWP